MKLLAVSGPHMNEGFTIEVGFGKGGSQGLGWALDGVLDGAYAPETFEGSVEFLSGDTELGCESALGEEEVGAKAEVVCETSNSGTVEAGIRPL